MYSLNSQSNYLSDKINTSVSNNFLALDFGFAFGRIGVVKSSYCQNHQEDKTQCLVKNKLYSLIQ